MAYSILAIAGAVTLLIECRAATQIVLHVTTNVSCQSIVATQIAVGSLDELETKPGAATKSSCEPSGRVGDLVVVPSGDNGAGVAFKIVTAFGGRSVEDCGKGGDYSRCIVARRALRYIPHAGLEVDVAMTADCEAIACDAKTTCVHGRCVDATIHDPALCERAGACDDSVLAPGDGGAPDGGNDAPGDGTSVDALVDGSVVCGAGCPALLSSGDGFACRVSGGQVLCWGDNGSGELGRSGNGLPDPNERAVAGLSGVVGISSGKSATCARRGDGTVSCWGVLFGLDTALDAGRASGVAVDIPAIRDATIVTLDTGPLCWSNGPTTRCAGDNMYGALGVGDMNPRSTPVTPGLPPGNVVALAAGNYTLCAMMADRSLYCWGGSTFGEADPAHIDGMPVPTPVRVDLSAFGRPVDVSVGEVHGCVVLEDTGVACWGSSDNAQTGHAPGGGGFPPERVRMNNGASALVGAKAISVGYRHSCALLATGKVTCWGDNARGQLGRGMALDAGSAGYPFAAEVTGLDSVSAIASSPFHTCALRNGAEIWCWGSNIKSEMGLPATTTEITTARRVR